ncbi:hypothetical protein [Mycobacterium haemophilum]|uniref:Lipoprotein LpqJ n=1 Tax=Mycobacterium haemophilum TaxID=29311 RepID=A0A0I9TW91_9MYCO|nr:hypothetical protein [Mycobacterium haemophilum]KLO25407.1 hypothetical protein ABH39_20010 [Mycobacterium haemophilum]KLO34014.1 hypothetical protein ABH38_20050 [Mycobacterium haemophilum]KLO38327.1 hypothetical protein ABH37_18810 [Mycobacterium haemophilum]KLO43119.1 hypothetical protein ABH36_19925 [Mycobacterium haemophilum]
MRFSQKTRRSLAGGSLLLAAVLASPMLIDGCSSIIEGKPVAVPGTGPTEPSFPTPRSTPPTTRSPNAAPPSAPAGPAGAIPLPPDQNGYVFIETKSGVTRCQISTTSVGCEAPFTHSPMQDGEHANGVNVTANGSVQWVLGNLGAIPTVTIDYKIYAAQGWTIDATADGTRFTNNRTGHGMFVSIDKVDTF